MFSDKLLQEVPTILKRKSKVKYKVIDTTNPNDISETTLNEFNKYGWELVSIVSCLLGETPGYKMIFKSIEEVFVPEP
ncbi:MAG: hypothetical protein KKA84_14605 [Bacteroidetes bacterium]|nr:hypothetical protein [Bacteroidota bacterium]